MKRVYGADPFVLFDKKVERITAIQQAIVKVLINSI